uniref:Uncharacterized protein n=1 Tax=Romanomermis culicivorax TaxID=13658 RepID=A0A915L1L9_ROMCU
MCTLKIGRESQGKTTESTFGRQHIEFNVTFGIAVQFTLIPAGIHQVLTIRTEKLDKQQKLWQEKHFTNWMNFDFRVVGIPMSLIAKHLKIYILFRFRRPDNMTDFFGGEGFQQLQIYMDASKSVNFDHTKTYPDCQQPINHRSFRID